MFRAVASVVAVAMLAGCAGAPEGPIRNVGVPITSLALYDPARMAGDWHLVAAYGEEVACGPVTERWTPRGDGTLAVSGTACRGASRVSLDTVALPSGPGRFERRGVSGRETLWVLWADADDRVAVIGTPDGGFGRILSREPALRPDLMQAARQVLDFNGYDLARLRFPAL